MFVVLDVGLKSYHAVSIVCSWGECAAKSGFVRTDLSLFRIRFRSDLLDELLSI